MTSLDDFSFVDQSPTTSGPASSSADSALTSDSVAVSSPNVTQSLLENLWATNKSLLKQLQDERSKNSALESELASIRSTVGANSETLNSASTLGMDVRHLKDLLEFALTELRTARSQADRLQQQLKQIKNKRETTFDRHCQTDIPSDRSYPRTKKTSLTNTHSSTTTSVNPSPSVIQSPVDDWPAPPVDALPLVGQYRCFECHAHFDQSELAVFEAHVDAHFEDGPPTLRPAQGPVNLSQGPVNLPSVSAQMTLCGQGTSAQNASENSPIRDQQNAEIDSVVKHTGVLFDRMGLMDNSRSGQETRHSRECREHPICPVCALLFPVEASQRWCENHIRSHFLGETLL